MDQFSSGGMDQIPSGGSMVDLHGGTILARCDGVGRGTEFVVNLPILPEQAQAARARSQGAR